MLIKLQINIKLGYKEMHYICSDPDIAEYVNMEGGGKKCFQDFARYWWIDSQWRWTGHLV